MLRRRWRWVAVPAVAGLIVGYGLVRVLPKQYTSETLMLVERPQVPNSYVQPISTEDLNAQIAQLQEQVLSRSGLAPIIERDGLLPNNPSNQALDSMVGLLQQAVTLTPITPTVHTTDQTVPGFYLSVALDKPQIAQRVCADIASAFIDQDLRQQESAAEGTTDFLENQLGAAKQNLNQQDAILAKFERKYMGALPDETKTNLSMLSTLNTQLQAVTEDLGRASQNQAYLDSVLSQELQAWKMETEMREGYFPDGYGNSNPLIARLANAEAQLASLRAHYTTQYPDVAKTEAEIAELKKEIEQGSGLAVGGKFGAKAAMALEPASIQSVRGQLRAVQETIVTDRQQQEHIRRNIQFYESRLRLVPAVEEQYKKITRDHDTALKFYNTLLAKEDDSEMATSLEQRQQGQQLKVMDPADLPSSPSFPQPLLFMGGGLAGGLALGLALVLAIETSDKRIRTERDLQYYLGTAAFGLIPSIETDAIRRLTDGNGAGKRRRPVEV